MNYAIPTELTSQLGVGPRSWVQILYRPEFFFSGLIFTTAQVVFITTKITFISAVQLYDFDIFTVV